MEMEETAAADLAASDDREQGKDDDAASRLTYEIFSLLESKFLFGCSDVPATGLFPPAAAAGVGPARARARAAATASTGRKVCVLSIDGGARAADGLLAGAALVRLEAALRRRAGSPAARLADFFDVAAGSGAGGVLAALLFARGPHGGRPLCTADEALPFLLRRVRRRHRAAGTLGQLVFARRRGPSYSAAAGGALGRALGDLTLRDTVRPVLVPCYDLATRAPFLFSRADAAESAAHDFRLRDVCAATCAGGGVVEVASVDGGTRIRAVGGGVALGNPTAAAITHVLNNRREFPAAVTIDDLLVMSIGTGTAEAGGRSRRATEVASIAAEGVSDMVDQAVAMAFGHSRTTNYIRIQGTGGRCSGGRAPRACGGETKQQAVWKAEAMLLQKSVESVLFQGRKLAGETNADKLERFARELAKEHARRKQNPQLTSPAAGDSVVASSAAAPSNDKQQQQPPPPTTTTSMQAKKATVSASTPTVVAPRRRRQSAPATKHAPATSRPEDDGSTR